MSTIEGPTTCIPDSTVCYEGRGICDESSLTCTCKPEYSQMTDLIKVSDCSQNIAVGKALYSLLLVGWTVVLIGAIVGVLIIRRKNEKSERVEIALLVVLILSAIGYISSSLLILTSEPYGFRSSGNDVATTILVSLTIIINWAFLLTKPAVSVSGLSSAMFSYTGFGRRVYQCVAPVLVIGTIFAGVLPIFISFSIGDNQTIVSTIYLLCASIAFVMALFVGHAGYKVRSNILLALKSTPDLSEPQRVRLQGYHKKATSLLSIATACALVCTTGFTALGASWEIAKRNSWIVYPLIFIFNSLWGLRHVHNNIKLSLYIKSREQMISSSPLAAEMNAVGNQDRANDGGAVEGEFDSPTPLTRISPLKSAARKSRRKIPRGLKRKPLETMTAVTERTAEGTVQHTYVEGLDDDFEDNSSKNQLTTSQQLNSTEEARTGSSKQ